MRISRAVQFLPLFGRISSGLLLFVTLRRRTQIRLDARGFEKARFLNIGDTLTIGGEKYLVSQEYLKMFDYQLLVELDGSEIYIIVGVKKVTAA